MNTTLWVSHTHRLQRSVEEAVVTFTGCGPVRRWKLMEEILFSHDLFILTAKAKETESFLFYATQSCLYLVHQHYL